MAGKRCLVLHLLEIARQPRACYDCLIPPVTMTGHAVGCVSPRIEEPMKVSKVGGPKGPDTSKKAKQSGSADGAFAEALGFTSALLGTFIDSSARDAAVYTGAVEAYLGSFVAAPARKAGGPLVANGCIELINPAGARMLGAWPAQTLVGRAF